MRAEGTGAGAFCYWKGLLELGPASGKRLPPPCLAVIYTDSLLADRMAFNSSFIDWKRFRPLVRGTYG